MSEHQAHSAPIDTLECWRCAECPRCGYNLRGLARGSNCPECGLDCVGAIMIRGSELGVLEAIMSFFVAPILVFSAIAMSADARVIGMVLLAGGIYCGYRGIRLLRRAHAGRALKFVAFCPSCILINAFGWRGTVSWDRTDRVTIEAGTRVCGRDSPSRASLFVRVRGAEDRRGPVREALAGVVPDWFAFQMPFRATARDIDALRCAIDTMQQQSRPT